MPNASMNVGRWALLQHCRGMTQKGLSSLSREVDGRDERGAAEEQGRGKGWIHIHSGKEHKGNGRERERGGGVGEGEGARILGAGQESVLESSRPRTCIDVHGKSIFLVRHQAVCVILGHDADDMVLQFGVEVKVNSSDIGNDSAWLC